MTNTQVHPMPKEILRLPDGFDSTVKRAVEAVVMVFGVVLRRPFPRHERVGDGVQMRRGVLSRAVAVRMFRERSAGKVQAVDMD